MVEWQCGGADSSCGAQEAQSLAPARQGGQYVRVTQRVLGSRRYGPGAKRRSLTVVEKGKEAHEITFPLTHEAPMNGHKSSGAWFSL